MTDSINFNQIQWGTIFSAQIPEYWEFIEDNGIINIFNDRCGVGVLQISIIKNVEGRATEKLASDFTEDFINSRAIQKYSINYYKKNNNIFSVTSFKDSFEEEIDFWKVWHIFGDSWVLFITYNSLDEDKDLEVDICDEIVNSIKLLS